MNPPRQKLFLLDALALVYRAHFAFSKTPRINSKGLNTSATFGFTNTLLEILNKEKPTHIGVAFDTHVPTFRHESFPAYKAHRQEQPEDITTNIPYIHRLLHAFGIPVLFKDGFEADDVIGTLAKRASLAGFEVFMMTSDKDYCQLVDDHVFVYRPAFMGKGPEVYDRAKVLEKFSIKNVDQVRDILGLQGDAADNIPGIPGIGEKTAQKLIDQFESVENLISNAEQLTGKLKENVIQFAEQGLMSKQLATIMTDVPIDFDENALLYTGLVPDEIRILFEELEFRALKSKLLGEEDPKATPLVSKNAPSGQLDLFGAPASSPAPSIENAPVFATEDAQQEADTSSYATAANSVHFYHVADTLALQQGLVSYLLQQKEVCFDSETDSVEAQDAALVGLSFSVKEKEAFYVPFPADETQAKEILAVFKPFFENESIAKIGQNLKYDVTVLKSYGIEVKGALIDTMLAHYLLEPDMRHGMDVLSETYLKYKPISITSLIGKKGSQQGNMRDVELDKIAEYAAEDADVTFRLKQILVPALGQGKMQELFAQVECPLIQVLSDMEIAGVAIDVEALKESSQVLENEIKATESQIFQLAGEPFNVASPKQLGVILFEKLKLDPKAKKTSTGQYATGEEILSKLAYEHEIASKILEYRELQKLKSTYVDALPTMINPYTGRVHTSYNQAVAATGRLSSTNPNLQNIPIRTDRGKEIRKAFIPKDKEHIILSADYSQIELRIMAAFSQDQSMLEAFKNGIDIHSTTAAKVFGVDVKDVTGEMRRKAKMVNFGIIYGITPFGLAQRLSIPRKEAGEIIDSYFREFSSIKAYMDNCIQQAREMGYVETILGRRRVLRDINSANQTIRGFAERNAINAPIQGSAADMIKVAMIQIHDWLKKEGLKTQMVLQVHDELVFDVYKPELEIIKENVTHFMKNAITLDVPMEVGLGVGENWLEAH